MPNKKIISTLLCSFFSLGMIGSALVAKTHSNPVLRSSASGESSNQVLKTELSLDDFSLSEEVTRKELTVDIRSANKTPLSNSVTFEFESIRTKGYSSSKKTAYVVIDDANYSGDTSDPLLDASLGSALNGYTKELGNVSINGGNSYLNRREQGGDHDEGKRQQQSYERYFRCNPSSVPR